MGIIKYRYYDHPEGQDLFGKLVITNAYTGTVGFIWSTYDVLMITKPQGYFNTIYRYAYHTGPALGMATAFTLTTYMATKLRGKDDTWNYTAGSCAAGAVLGAWKKSPVLGSCGALFFSIAGYIKKLSLKEGWVFFPEVVHGTGNVTFQQKDWTWIKERPRNWTTGKE